MYKNADSVAVLLILGHFNI